MNDDLSYRFAPAAGVFLIPGIGEVVIAGGVITLASVGTIIAGNWLYDKIVSYISSHSTPKESISTYYSKKYDIPKKLIDSDGNVKIGSFSQKIKGKTAYKDPKNWIFNR
ncbi:hypothetical protein MOO44_00870 (plasmid) [Nicoliella spurrieriana]|uniref:Uncharacterized protein n=1 Tax=Nicoliella spurrieriana TaxID=2925830 RepID=A0A976RQZ3_9LACO|nr:hypothetical protein [Nicoliella spurrieriana]UQS86224.1 hypothetical protein MOO44_00870 [Nicoliella spurrieriana]